MTIQFLKVELTAETTAGTAHYETEFKPGLNVLNASNTWGKSTLMQSIVFALGLEGSFTTSRRVPLGPAMTQHIDTAQGRTTIVASHVTLTLANDRGQLMRVRRWAVSDDVRPDLMQVWLAEDVAGLDGAVRQDMFVGNRSVLSQVGFHRQLEHFLGWNLPLVPNHSGSQTKLYAETLWPLSYIEQKHGWSGLSPRVPTHYGLRNPLRRAVEFTLGLTTLSRLTQLDALKEEEAAVGREWGTAVGRAVDAAAAEGFRVSFLDERPVTQEQRRRSVLEVSIAQAWLTGDAAEREWTRALEQSAEIPPLAGERTPEARQALLQAERDVRRLAARVRDVREQLALAEADQDALVARLASVEADKRRLQDIQRLQSLGSDLGISLISTSLCPTCSQNVDDRDAVSGIASSIGENLRLIEGERSTLLSLQAASIERTKILELTSSALESDLAGSRETVRLSKDELLGPSNAPSVSVLQQRLQLQARLRALTRVDALRLDIEEQLDELAGRLADVRRRRAALAAGGADSNDARLLSSFRRSFQEQLGEYQLRSVRPAEVTIDEDSLLPVSEGFELTFDLSTGVSASDMIRTKWAYLLALNEAAASGASGNRSGIMMLDEPRQQETQHTSLRAFLRRLSANAGITQTIYATSEDPAVLVDLLSGLEVYQLAHSGEHLLRLA